MYDSLFQALAQAKAQPSHGFRAFESAAQIPGDALSGYMEGRQAKMQMQQPEAMARMLNSTPQGHEMIETMGPQAATSAMYGMQPKDLMDYMGKSAQLQQQGNLGWGNINERNTASQRMADAAAARTTAQEDIASGRTLSGAIGMHQQAINSLSNQMTQLAKSEPTGVGGTIQNLISKNQDVSQYLGDPKFAALAGQMKSLQTQIGQHQQILGALTHSQGLAGSSLNDNSDLNAINPNDGGDTSQSGGANWLTVH